MTQMGRLFGLLLIGASLAGCASSGNTKLPVTEAPPPKATQPQQNSATAMACIRDSGALRGVTFGVGGFVDSTGGRDGKGNYVSPGSTGNIMPGAGTAVFVTKALKAMGGVVYVQYLGPAARQEPVQYKVTGMFNSVDLSQTVDGDLQFGGGGPKFSQTLAFISMSIELDDAATLRNHQASTLERAIYSRQAGVTVGKVWDTTLVTGGVMFTDQQRIQYESIQTIGLGVAKAMVDEFPAARKRCGQLVYQLLEESRTPPTEVAEVR